jgi:hypothetical protein
MKVDEKWLKDATDSIAERTSGRDMPLTGDPGTSDPRDMDPREPKSKSVEERIKEIDTQTTEIDQEILQLTKKKNDILKRTPIQCERCQSVFTIGEIVYIQTEWYVMPTGCTDGDYWCDGEGQFACPNCTLLNRIHKYNRGESAVSRYRDLRHLFQRIDRKRK